MRSLRRRAQPSCRTTPWRSRSSASSPWRRSCCRSSVAATCWSGMASVARGALGAGPMAGRCCAAPPCSPAWSCWRSARGPGGPVTSLVPIYARNEPASALPRMLVGSLTPRGPEVFVPADDRDEEATVRLRGEEVPFTKLLRRDVPVRKVRPSVALPGQAGRRAGLRRGRQRTGAVLGAVAARTGRRRSFSRCNQVRSRRTTSRRAWCRRGTSRWFPPRRRQRRQPGDGAQPAGRVDGLRHGVHARLGAGRRRRPDEPGGCRPRAAETASRRHRLPGGAGRGRCPGGGSGELGVRLERELRTVPTYTIATPAGDHRARDARSRCSRAS